VIEPAPAESESDEEPEAAEEDRAAPPAPMN